jgi:subtilisin family serine protease
MKLLYSLPFISYAFSNVLVAFHDNTIVTTSYNQKFIIGDLVIYHFDLNYSPKEWSGNVLEMDLNHDVSTYYSTNLWNLDRISHRRPSKNYEYITNFYGKNSTVYIIDTGIDIEHPEFEGRAVHGFDSTNDHSCINLHGTHVAGTVGSHTYGVAKNSTLVDVRVLNCQGSGSY